MSDPKDRVGAIYPIPLDSEKKRASALAALQKLMPGWEPQPFRGDPSTGYGSPTRGGLSNQVDGIGGGIIHWMLTGEDDAWEKAQNRAWSLINQPEDQDSGHIQRWDSIALTAMAYESQSDRRAMLSAWLGILHRAWNSRYVLDPDRHLKGGIRPQVRAVHVLFSFAHYLERLEEIGELSGLDMSNIPKPAEIRKRAMAAGDTLYRSGPGRTWSTASASKDDPVSNWAYTPTDDDYAIGKHVVAFHCYWIWPYEAMRAEVFGAKIPQEWTNRIRQMATWTADMTLAPDQVLAMKAGSGSFRPSTFRGQAPIDGKTGGPVETGRFREWTEPSIEARGENSYPVFPLMALCSGGRRARLQIARRYADTCKTVWTPGEIEPSLLWAAAKLQG